MKIFISIVIITRNRRILLEKGLIALLDLIKVNYIEIIVIDNKSTDTTLHFLYNISQKFNNLSYYSENNIGSSFARNRGINLAKGDWICFLDDDGIPENDFIAQLELTIRNYNFDGFGGMWYPYASKCIPNWIPREVIEMRLLRNDIGIISPDNFFAAGICCFKKNILIAAGLFPEFLGPVSGKMGYGEENYLQYSIVKMGGHLGFNPFWKMRHYVSDEKFTLFWNLRRFYLKGSAEKKVNVNLSFTQIIFYTIKAFIYCILLLLKNFGKLLFYKNYTYHNYFIDSLRFSLRLIGRIF